MGLFHVTARLSGPTGRSETLPFLVDTGATFLVVPQEVAERLELQSARTCPIQTAGGRDEVWPRPKCGSPSTATRSRSEC